MDAGNFGHQPANQWRMTAYLAMLNSLKPQNGKRLQGVTPPAKPLNRWMAWAGALVDRHGRLVSRRDPFEFVLLRLQPVVITHQNRFVSSRQMGSQIKLAIQPILHQTFVDQRQFSSWSVARQPAPQTSSGERHSSLANATAVGELRRLREPLEIERRHIVQQSESLLLEKRELLQAARSPLARIFRQLRLAESLPSKSVGQQIEQVADTITRRTQRIEERSFSSSSVPTVTRQTANFIEREVKQAVAAESTLAGSSSGQSATGQARRASMGSGADFRQQAGAQSPQVNIEQIADQVMRQIDRRFVAQRERMGKIR